VQHNKRAEIPPFCFGGAVTPYSRTLVHPTD
jgi:hypothetical protein